MRTVEKVVKCHYVVKLVITECYGLRATTTDGQTALAPSLYFAYVPRDKTRVIEGPNTCDQ